MSKEPKKTDNIQDILKNSVIKIKNTEQMYSYVKKILKNSGIDSRFGYFTFKGDKLSLFGGDNSFNSDEIKNMINTFLHKKNVMGEIVPFESNEFIVVPIFETDEESEILILNNKKSVKDFVEDEFSTVLKNIHIYRQLKLKCEQLTDLTHIDEITGLYNQRKLAKDLESTIHQHLETKESFSLMFIDIDFFKEVNDNFGHIIGSEILHDLGSQLKALVRSTDDVYRFGGDEFIILLRQVDIETVRLVGLRILKSIVNHDFLLSTGDKYKMSISIGIAEYPTDAVTSKEIIQLADKMMYKSKKTGRGKVIHLGKEVKDADASSE